MGRKSLGLEEMDRLVICKKKNLDFNQLYQLLYNYILVGGLEHVFFFSDLVGNVIIPTDELIFFRGVGTPPTSY
jgi:hypothetical protein